MSTCDEVEAILTEVRLGETAALVRLDEIPDAKPCIAAGLTESARDEDWIRFAHYLWAAFRHPDRAMTHQLCDVLDRRLDEVTSEDIVEVLQRIADPAAVLTLANVAIRAVQGVERCCWQIRAACHKAPQQRPAPRPDHAPKASFGASPARTPVASQVCRSGRRVRVCWPYWVRGGDSAH